MSEVRNKRLSDDEFYSLRNEVLQHWETGKDVARIEDGVAYQKTIPAEKNFSSKLRLAKESGHTLIQPRAGVALIDKHIELLRFLQDEGEADLLPTTIDSYTRQKRSGLSEVGRLGVHWAWHTISAVCGLRTRAPPVTTICSTPRRSLPYCA